VSDCVKILYELLLPNNTAGETFLHKYGAAGRVDRIFIIGALTERICDSGQKVLKFSIQTGRSGSPSPAIFSSLSHSLLEI